MHKYQFSFFAIMFVIISSNIWAQEEVKEPPPLDPKFMGTHGMVIISNDYTLYASHLPTYNVPHNAQIIYSLDVGNAALIHLVRDADLVTIKPKPFNLEHLIRGNELTITADVYMGHFERGGLLTFSDVSIKLKKQLYLRMLDAPDKSHIRQQYDSVELNGNARILVHQIQTAPSYDHLVLFYENKGCVTNIRTSSAVPNQAELYNKLRFCGPMKPLYYETQDFGK